MQCFSFPLTHSLPSPFLFALNSSFKFDADIFLESSLLTVYVESGFFYGKKKKHTHIIKFKKKNSVMQWTEF